MNEVDTDELEDVLNPHTPFYIGHSGSKVAGSQGRVSPGCEYRDKSPVGACESAIDDADLCPQASTSVFINGIRLENKSFKEVPVPQG